MTNNLTSIDLFAGCGGLSLGLEQAGFETIFVNELNPDAMDSFLINRQDNPYLKDPANRLYDLVELTQDPEALQRLRKRLHQEFGDIDIVSGGPPCQGYSGIGHRSTFKELNTRKEAIPTNHLYKEMVKFVQEIAPRAFIFENVRGLLSARKPLKVIKANSGKTYKRNLKPYRLFHRGNRKHSVTLCNGSYFWRKITGFPRIGLGSS